MDAGYAGYPVLVTSRKQNYRLNLKTRAKERDEKLNDPQHQARRWIVERTQSWLKPLPQTPGQLRKTEASFTAAYQDAAERAASNISLCADIEVYLGTSRIISIAMLLAPIPPCAAVAAFMMVCVRPRR